MSIQNRKRKNDIDEPTPSRVNNTLDILDDYPFLTKQLQAGCALRDLDIASHVQRTLNMRGSVFNLLNEILLEVTVKFLGDYLELVILERPKMLTYIFTENGDGNSVRWLEEKRKQPFIKNKREIRTRAYDTPSVDEMKYYLNGGKPIPVPSYILDDQETEADYKRWLIDNPEPESVDMDYVLRCEIFTGEIERFIERYRSLLENMGIDFFFCNESKQFDGFQIDISDKSFY